ncbi:hypothetical protein [Dendronalium sp. ChiSLP03b]|uniref:hypothetical protein n=1 Tax=Dendronalium sp. ChiSLP03b TaxID=3075381 RepID=UPI002AD2CFE3|nr:hypothetical protein [Dendronalium sp. ChiSLP03b]MDZ8204069.1 hypothetical protein [Dendronalium sp. ChiSLP03b]
MACNAKSDSAAKRESSPKGRRYANERRHERHPKGRENGQISDFSDRAIREYYPNGYSRFPSFSISRSSS